LQLKKLMVLLAMVGALAAVAIAPLSATAKKPTGNSTLRCPPGTNDKHYCTHEKDCVVPNLVGQPGSAVKALLAKNRCTLGKKTRISGPGPKGPGIVYAQSPAPGTVHAAGFPVNVFIVEPTG
jgi:hypothetical protein